MSSDDAPEIEDAYAAGVAVGFAWAVHNTAEEIAQLLDQVYKDDVDPPTWTELRNRLSEAQAELDTVRREAERAYGQEG